MASVENKNKNEASRTHLYYQDHRPQQNLQKDKIQISSFRKNAPAFDTTLSTLTCWHFSAFLEIRVLYFALKQPNQFWYDPGSFCVSSEISSSFYECKNFAKFFYEFFSRWYKVRDIGRKSIILNSSMFPHFPASFEKSETSQENFIHFLFDICVH